VNVDELWWTYRCLQYLQEMTIWYPPDRSDVQVLLMDTGIGRWVWKTHDGRWMTGRHQQEALRLWSMDRHA